MAFNKLENFLSDENEKKGTELYVVDKEENIFDIELTTELVKILTTAFIQSIKKELFEKDIEIVNINQIDDYYPNHIIHLSKDKDYTEIDFFSNFDRKKVNNSYKLNVKTLKNVLGFILIIGNEKQQIELFKYLYPVNLITNDKVLRIVANENRLGVFKNNVITFNDQFDFFKYKNKTYIINIKLLERKFKYDKVIIEGTKSSFEKIKKINIVDNPDLLFSFINESRNLKWAKKIRNLASSKVLELKAKTIKDFINSKDKLKNKFTFKNNKIILETKSNKQDFIKLLEDDYLTSELTRIMYEAAKKSNLE